jgi:general secretion pathway protein D
LKSRSRALRPFRTLAVLLACTTLTTGCQPVEKPDLPTVLPPLRPGTPVATPQTDSNVGSLRAIQRARVSYGGGAGVQAPGAGYANGGQGGDITLDFADTDIREAAAQILGSLMHVNYTVDPGVKGTVTLHTAAPISRDQLLPTLQVLLSQVGAALTASGGLYRIEPAAAASSAGLGSGSAAGATVVPLRNTSADALAKVLAPYAGASAKIVADPAANAIIVNSEPQQREAIVAMIRAFDVDTLANQSFALLPVDSGDAKDFATALEKTLGADQGKSLANVVRVVPMSRIDAVLVVVPTERMMSDVRRVYGLVLQQRRQTVRAWHVYYLQNGRSNDVAYVLQQAFTPDHVTAQPTQQNQLQQIGQTQSALGGSGSGSSGGVGGGLGGSSGGLGGSVTGGGAFGQSSNTGNTQQQGAQGAGQNPLLGGLDQGGTGAGGNTKDEMRIIPADQNNAILIYGTPQELETVETTLHKIDIVPLQVRIDATVAEVDLNNALEYGTQFFFKQAGGTTTGGGIAGTSLTGNTTTGSSTSTGGALTQAFTATSTALSGGGFAGFLLSGSNSQQAALDLLQSVSKVRVLSSPELVVLDNQPARLQVGNDVPVLSQQSQSTIASNAPLVNSVSYVPTGVMLQITPRVNDNGQVTLDIAEDVSQSQGIQTSGNASAPASPTFQDRNVQSRVVVQDGQTIGIAGLIQDQDSRQNQGVPFIRNIPVIGALFGQQVNQRTRTELLVMITPHVERDARDARNVTEDMEQQVPFAAAVPAALQRLPQAGLSDPQAHVLHGLGLAQ